MTSPVCPPTIAAGGAVVRRADDGDAAIVDGPAWFLLADDIGGHRGAGVAATAAIRAVGLPRTVEDVTRAIDRANTAVRDRARADAAVGMGASLVGAVVVDDQVVVVHVGHTRCYRLADGALRLVTRDHTQARELVDLGRLDDRAARDHPLGHVVTRALGLDPTISPDVTILPRAKCRLLLCSSHVGSALAPRTIGRVLAGLDEPLAAAQRLVDLAAAPGGRASAVVVDVEGES